MTEFVFNPTTLDESVAQLRALYQPLIDEARAHGMYTAGLLDYTLRVVEQFLEAYFKANKEKEDALAAGNRVQAEEAEAQCAYINLVLQIFGVSRLAELERIIVRERAYAS